MIYIYLIAAILFEVVATTALKASEGFTRIPASVITIAGYGLSFYFLSQTLKGLPIGIVYAIWSGAGIVMISLIGWLWFKQQLDGPALLGIGLILAGVLVLNLFSKSSVH